LFTDVVHSPTVSTTGSNQVGRGLLCRHRILLERHLAPSEGVFPALEQTANHCQPAFTLRVRHSSPVSAHQLAGVWRIATS